MDCTARPPVRGPAWTTRIWSPYRAGYLQNMRMRGLTPGFTELIGGGNGEIVTPLATLANCRRTRPPSRVAISSPLMSSLLPVEKK